jgi:hypothetical protein
MARLAGIDDCEAPMAERRAPSRLVNRLGSPYTFIVTTTMLDCLQHHTNVSLRIEAD